MRKTMRMLVLLVAVISLSNSAGAAIFSPEACKSRQDMELYNKGILGGKAFFAAGWGKGDCTHIPDVEAYTLDMITGHVSDGHEDDCLFAGTITGLLGQFHAAFSSCKDSCVAAGRIQGKIAATAYCGLTSGQDGVVNLASFVLAPTNHCSVGFQGECEVNFTNVTGQCSPFAQGTIQPLLEQSK